jgi:hypothetical protein
MILQDFSRSSTLHVHILAWLQAKKERDSVWSILPLSHGKLSIAQWQDSFCMCIIPLVQPNNWILLIVHEACMLAYQMFFFFSFFWHKWAYQMFDDSRISVAGLHSTTRYLMYFTSPLKCNFPIHMQCMHFHILVTGVTNLLSDPVDLR